MTMREKIGRALYAKNPMYFTLDNGEDAPVPIPWEELAANDHPQLQAAWIEDADAVLDAMREPSMEILAEGYRAMFADKWDCSQAPMIGAGWDAMIDAAKGGA